ncbi:MAG TPA: hypothetical protein VE242_05145, partial [Chthoniobacterales bacterium]|nr:hypothetical protein [Chthoniobacterales bacterium]
MRLLPARVGLAMGFAVLNPFLIRILKTRAARTLLLAIVMFAILLFSSCANGDFIYTSGRQRETFGLDGVPSNSAFIDWTKPARDQSGPSYSEYNGIGEP